MQLIDQFEQAVADSKTLTEKPGTDVLLKLYAFYKQSTNGDVTTDLPAGAFDVVAKIKHSAWKDLKGSSKESAMQYYIDLIAKLKG